MTSLTDCFKSTEYDDLSRSELIQLAQTMEYLDSRYREVIDLIPPCPVHGEQCLPWAKSWIESKLIGDRPSSP